MKRGWHPASPVNAGKILLQLFGRLRIMKVS
jgi:hypothetical protein